MYQQRLVLPKYKVLKINDNRQARHVRGEHLTDSRMQAGHKLLPDHISSCCSGTWKLKLLLQLFISM